LRGLVLCLAFFSQALFAQWQTNTLPLGDDAEAVLHQWQSAESVQIELIWFASEYGVLPQQKQIAQQLVERLSKQYAVRVSLVDFYEALFRSPSASALDQVPPAWTGQVISQLHSEQKLTWLIAGNRAAQTVLLGLEQIQSKQALSQLGVLMLNPNLYLQTPEVGQAAQYLPQVAHSNVPIAILQAELSPWRWRLSELSERLAQGGSDVFVQQLAEVRDRFYFRPDAMEREQALTQRLADDLLRLMRLQLSYLFKHRQVELIQVPVERAQASKTLSLQPYKGVQGLSLEVVDLQGKSVSLRDYQGKVVLLNFWASWCPPCVHEMPSMQALQDKFSPDEFVVLAVNLGESIEQVRAFVAQHQLVFSVAVDASGQAVKAWQVFAYPSSYLIDSDGVIRQALFGATDWRNPEYEESINNLLH